MRHVARMISETDSRVSRKKRTVEMHRKWRAAVWNAAAFIYRAIFRLSTLKMETADLRNTGNYSPRQGCNHYSHCPQKLDYGRSFARPKCKWVNNIKIDLKLIGCGLDSACSR